MNDQDKTKDELISELIALNEQLQREVQQRSLAETSLRESEEKYRTLVEACPDGVVMTDLTGHFAFASQHTVELLGVESEEELLGREAADFVVQGEKEQFNENVVRLQRDAVHRDVQYSFIRKDGAQILGELSSAVVRDGGGRPRGLMAVIRDVTQRKRAEDGAAPKPRRTQRDL